MRTPNRLPPTTPPPTRPAPPPSSSATPSTPPSAAAPSAMEPPPSSPRRNKRGMGRCTGHRSSRWSALPRAPGREMKERRTQVVVPNLHQTALYEAFGLAVGEAMTCGLPTFVTLQGGPAENIEHGVSGFHIDPYHPDQAATLMDDFFEQCEQDPTHWVKISDRGLQPIYDKYTWKIYSERLMTLAGVYGFSKYVSNLERRETRHYLEMFYNLHTEVS